MSPVLRHRARRSLASAASISLVALAALSPSAGAAAPTVARCAYGGDVPGLTGVLPAGAAAAENRYAATLTGMNAAARDHARKVFAAALAAYVYGYPQVTEQATVTKFPRNAILSVAALIEPSVHAVVAPNHDTAYMSSSIDLSGGPLVIDVPNTHGRYYVLELLDAYTNAFGYIGRRATGTEAGSYAIVPPGWHGTLPAGLKRIDAPTDSVWMIGRILVNNEADIANVKALQQQFHMTPLASWEQGTRQPSITLDSFPATVAAGTVVPTGAAFISALDQSLALNPPPAGDRCALEAMTAAGVTVPRYGVAGATVSSSLDAALTAGTDAGARIVADATSKLISERGKANNGWAVMGSWVGRYGNRYLARAVMTKFGLGANVPQEAQYPVALNDNAGRALNGKHRYRITFAHGQLPPVNAFWSVTMYGSDYFLYANPLQRYTIGNRTAGLHYGRNGSLTIYIQHNPPANPNERANWLPAPSGPFRMMLRLYQPRPAAINGIWKPPAIVRAASA